MALHLRLRQARLARGGTVEAFAREAGLSLRLLQAIEDGRWDDLPAGIYARSAIKSYAAAAGLDGAEILSGCDGLLPEPDDPVATMGRLCGVRHPRPAAVVAQQPAASPQPDPDQLWQPALASLLDALILGACEAILIAGTRIVLRLPAGQEAAGALVFMGALITAAYHWYLGGIAGATVGDAVTGHALSGPRLLALSTITRRATDSCLRELRIIFQLGRLAGSRLSGFRTFDLLSHRS